MAPHEKKAGSTASLQDKLQIDPVEQALLEHPSYLELQQKLTDAEDQNNELKDRLLRQKAEMENTQRRMQRDIESAHKYGNEKFIMELLPIVDGLERALAAHAEEASGSGTLLDGVAMTLKMLYSAFEKFGIQQINPEMEPFNPEQHQAVSTQVNPAVKPGTVLSVLQKGYLLNNRLIRPALVVVAKAE